MQYPFVIFSLPRSRTAWLAQWLSYNGRIVGHDLGPHADTCQQFLDTLCAFQGTVETGAQDAHHLLRIAMPNSKFVIIRRSPDEVHASLLNFGVDDRAEVERRDAVLDEIDGLSIDYDALTDPRVCADLWEYLLGIPFDFAWWRYMDAQNIQIDVPRQLAFLASRHDQIAQLKHEVATTTDPQFLRIGWEPFDSVWLDAEPLAIAHSVEVNDGERHGHPFKLDVELLRQMEAAGVFRVMSARLNGRIVGYYTWSFLPDPESKGVIVADQGAWYADPSAPGIGRKMLDTSIMALKELGVQSVQMHHQLNGRGARLGTLFKRMGAIELQHRYSLWIGD